MSPRGIRNNNPLNIKIGNDWQGERPINTDGVFEQFETPEYGYRAAFIILRKYITKYNRNTIHKIIDSWAPDGEPYQSNYKKRVCDLASIGVHDPIDYANKTLMVAIVQAMACVENGIPVDKHPIIKGYEMANQTL